MFKKNVQTNSLIISLHFREKMHYVSLYILEPTLCTLYTPAQMERNAPFDFVKTALLANRHESVNDNANSMKLLIYITHTNSELRIVNCEHE